MKYFLNKTQLPDDILKAVLLAAAESAGASKKLRENVAIRVTPTSTPYRYSGSAFRRSFLNSQFHKELGMPYELIRISGLITMTIPTRLFTECRYRSLDADLVAKTIFRVAAHEYKHVVDFHNKSEFKNAGLSYNNRPQEKRAVKVEQKSLRELNDDPIKREAVRKLATAVELNETNYIERRTSKAMDACRKYIENFDDLVVRGAWKEIISMIYRKRMLDRRMITEKQLALLQRKVMANVRSVATDDGQHSSTV